MPESELLKLDGVGPKAAKTLEDCGYNTIEKITKATADELSELPGIGKATAEKFIASAKNLVTAEKAPAVAQPKAEFSKDTIPKPKEVKAATKPVVKPSDPMPSAKKPAAKAPAKEPAKKPIAKTPAKKPIAKTPAKKPEVKEVSLYAKHKVSVVAQKAIDNAPEMGQIKKKRGSTKPKSVRKEQVNQTYGIVNSVLHDRPGRSTNRSVVVKLYNTEFPLPRYLGRKVSVQFPNSTTKLTGVIHKLHGKKSSESKTVIVRFNKSVSPHILAARAIFV